MQLRRVVALAVAAIVAPRSATAAAVTPITKVIELLNGMLSKAKEEKHGEEERFAAMKQWCDLTSADKKRTIQASADAIKQLDADIAKAQADAERLGQEVSEHDADINGWELEAKETAKVRKDEKTEYSKTHLDYEESISALERAVSTLKAKSADVKQAPAEEAASLLEVRKVAALPRIPSHARLALTSFLQARAGQPEANAYEFQSAAVVNMLEKLRIRFQDEMRVLETEEVNKKHSFELIGQKLSDEIGYAEDKRAEKTTMKGGRLADAGEAKGDLAATQAAKSADEKYLHDLVAECDQKSKDYESRQVLRKGEIEAIGKAIEIVSSPDVAGAGDKHLPAAVLLQAKGGSTSLAQLRSSTRQLSPAQERVASLLSERAKKSHSSILAAIAARVAEDPFSKVRQMIKDLLVKLMEESNDEADHKAWCDTELATNTQTRDMKSTEAEQLSAQVDQLGSLAARLAQEISDLSDAITQIETAVAEATKARQEEKANNAVTVQDSKVAQAAVTQAIQVLKEYYAKAASATDFAQQTPIEDMPVTFDKPFQGQRGESGGVVGMLEIIQSDFARLEASTSSLEDDNQREFDTFVADSDQDKAVKDKEVRHKGIEKERTLRGLNQAKKDLKATQAELDAALEYYDKLKPSCVDTGETFEDRVARRKEEIQSLQEALKILNGEDLG